MIIEQIKAIADEYLNTPCDAHEVIPPMLVSFPNVDCFSELWEFFMMPEVRHFHVSACAHKGGCPAIFDINHALHQRKQATILDQWTLFQKLEGNEETERNLSLLLRERFRFPLLILSLQTHEMVHHLISADPRLEQQIIVADGSVGHTPILSFIKPQKGTVYALKLVEREVFVNYVRSIPELADELENRHRMQGISNLPLLNRVPRILVETEWDESMFPNAAIKIEMIDSPLAILKKFDISFESYEPSDGTEAQWRWLLESVAQTNRMNDSIEQLLGLSHRELDHLDKFTQWSSEQQWLYVLARKRQMTDNDYLNEVIHNTSSPNQFVRQLYRTIAKHKVSESDFWKLYKVRKDLLKQLQDNSGESENYCSWITHKESSIIYYITDLTRKERELALYYASIYVNDNNYNNYIKTLKSVYPALALYLEKCSLPISEKAISSLDEAKEISRYFDDYRRQKVCNHVSADFYGLVCEQAVHRVFYKFLPRDSSIHQICRTAVSIPTQVWFIDAMGIEFVPYIQRSCDSMGLVCNIQTCRANLPTITKYNTEFISECENAHIIVHNIKDIDELKHHSIQDTELQKSEIALHLIDELGYIQRILQHIKQKLQNNETKRAVIVSDHGASRLAVLASEPIYEVAEEVEDSGRICTSCDEAASISSALPADVDNLSKYVLADYGRFHGTNICRKASVEVHGGATLEEVLVPICEITLPQTDTSYEITNTTLEVKVSPRQCAILRLHSTTPSTNMHIQFKGNRFAGRIIDGDTKDGKMFVFTCDFIKTAGIYMFDVYINEICVKKDESFKAINSGMITNDDFF